MHVMHPWIQRYFSIQHTKLTKNKLNKNIPSVSQFIILITDAIILCKSVKFEAFSIYYVLYTNQLALTNYNILFNYDIKLCINIFN